MHNNVRGALNFYCPVADDDDDDGDVDKESYSTKFNACKLFDNWLFYNVFLNAV